MSPISSERVTEVLAVRSPAKGGGVKKRGGGGGGGGEGGGGGRGGGGVNFLHGSCLNAGYWLFENPFPSLYVRRKGREGC